MRALLLVCLVLCLPRGDAGADTSAPAARAELRLPVVSGCGCAYECAVGLRDVGGGVWEISHQSEDARMRTAVVATWCFDTLGRGTPAAAGRRGKRCLDVFYDRSACGGECIPTKQFLDCRKP